MNAPNNLFQQFYSLVNFSFYDYVAEPPKVTLNKIIKEFPSTAELLLPSGTKTYLLSCITNIVSPLTGYDSSTLRGDSTYFGSFIMNFISAGKNFISWASGMSYGTRKYEIFCPASDIFKMTAKMSMLYVGHNHPNFKALKSPLLTNFIAEFPAKCFLDGMELIKNAGRNRADINAWYDIALTPKFIIDVSRKSFWHAFAAKITIEHIAKPFASYIGPIAKESLEIIGVYKWLDYDYVLPISSIKIPLMPSLVLWSNEIITAIVIIPITRSGVYMINTQKIALVEKNGEFSCKKIGEVIRESTQKNITIKYQYDAEKSKTALSANNTCENGKEFTIFKGNATTSQNDQQIIVHYPESDDTVGWLMNGASVALGALEDALASDL